MAADNAASAPHQPRQPIVAIANGPTSNTAWLVESTSTSGGGDRGYRLTAYAICATVAS